MLRPFSKKGQGLPLTVIIIAMLSLVVLVILILIFTGQISLFQERLGGAAEQELQTMKATYGVCHPNLGTERTFLSDYKEASEDESAQLNALNTLQEAINYCEDFGTEADCDSTKCSWR